MWCIVNCIYRGEYDNLPTKTCTFSLNMIALDMFVDWATAVTMACRIAVAKFFIAFLACCNSTAWSDLVVVEY